MAQAKETSIWGKTLYTVWQCVWLQDGEHPQYAFRGAYFDQNEANAFLSTVGGYLPGINKVVPLQVEKQAISHNRLFWNQTHQKFTDQGCYMAVAYEQLIQSVYK